MKITDAKTGYVLLSVGVLIWLISRCIFILYPWHSGIVLQFGEIVRVYDAPTIYFKFPWQDVRRFDKRILTIDKKDPDRFITAEKENVLVDSYIKWRITDPRSFYKQLLGDEARASEVLLDLVNRGLRDEIGKRKVSEVVSGKRDEVMRVAQDNANSDAKNNGIEIVDVRMKRVELPEKVSENVYNNMREERHRIRDAWSAGREIVSDGAHCKRDRIIARYRAVMRSLFDCFT